MYSGVSTRNIKEGPGALRYGFG